MAKAHHTQLKLDKYHEDEDCDANGGKAIAVTGVCSRRPRCPRIDSFVVACGAVGRGSARV